MVDVWRHLGTWQINHRNIFKNDLIVIFLGTSKLTLLSSVQGWRLHQGVPACASASQAGWRARGPWCVSRGEQCNKYHQATEQARPQGVHLWSCGRHDLHTGGWRSSLSGTWISTVETLYSTIYYSKYFIELNIDKSTQYVALWTHKRHPIPRPFGRAMECLLWVLQQKLIVL